MFPETLSSLRRRRRRRRKKLLAAFVCMKLGIHVHEMDERAAASYARSLIRSAFRATYVDRCNVLVETEWVIIFRMKRSSMENLRNKLYPYLATHLSERNVEGRSHGNRRPLSVDEKLGIGLMTAGGCSMAGILQSYHVCKAAAYKTIWKFFVAVVESGVGRIYFPDTLYELQRKADEFLQHRGNLRLFHGCVGALDGLAVRIQLPSSKDCQHPLSYENRKGFASVNVQAIADGKERCMHLSCLTPGSTHDSTAWQVARMSRMWRRMRMVDPRYGRRFWLSLDDAYEATENQICPWAGTGLRLRAPYKDAFNYFLSAGTRNGIERLFGQVYQRWGMLWRPIRYPLRKVPTIVQAIFQLHNFLKEENDRHLPAVNTGLGERRAEELLRTRQAPDGFDHDFHPQDQCSLEEVEHRRYRAGQCPIREEITRQLEEQGIVRPDYGHGNDLII